MISKVKAIWAILCNDWKRARERVDWVIAKAEGSPIERWTRERSAEVMADIRKTGRYLTRREFECIDPFEYYKYFHEKTGTDPKDVKTGPPAK